ncbi:MAG: hypothetical protein A3K18_34185 [Lentisphaerae bacterium RIFOXYA12_64_32]|nr:MAG: hypothetical protein A3K18_34185 [Lentisphaerae bacterium RIFOXYA12_64_32]
MKRTMVSVFVVGVALLGAAWCLAAERGAAIGAAREKANAQRDAAKENRGAAREKREAAKEKVQERREELEKKLATEDLSANDRAKLQAEFDALLNRYFEVR